MPKGVYERTTTACANMSVSKVGNQNALGHTGVGPVTHGMSRTVTYNSWLAMKQRCGYRRHKDYSNYGGRGIKVCDRWLNSFENFLEDMGIKPEGTSIDRIQSDGDYTPENCRWSTAKEQANNRRGKLGAING